MPRLQLENHSDRPAPYHFVNVDNQRGLEAVLARLVAARCVLVGQAHGHHPARLFHGGHGVFWAPVADQLPQAGWEVAERLLKPKGLVHREGRVGTADPGLARAELSDAVAGAPGPGPRTPTR